jgi:predicted HD superfamily hydrolase involved in NAD metabolism
MLESYLINFTRTGEINIDAPNYLVQLGYEATAKHCTAVAAEAKSLATRFGEDLRKAKQAGYLHDISAVIPNDKKIPFAINQKVDILAEEMQFPMIIHQKLSVILAKKVFQISDQEILSAVGCHTTLKAKASRLDKVVFLADKVAWDQAGKPPYLDNVISAMDISLDSAVLEYLNFLWERRERLRVLHPWLIEARKELRQGSLLEM